MAQNVDSVYKTADQIVAEVIADWQTRIPDMNFGADSIARIWVEVLANTEEGLYLMAQLLFNDMFIPTMNALALMRSGEMYGRPQKTGTLATGTVLFSGSGGTVVPVGTTVAAPGASEDDTLVFATTSLGTIPNPGTPSAPTLADAGAGALGVGTYEMAISFLTLEGETEIGPPSTALAIAASHNITVTAIPLGGPGTIGRSIYYRLNGGAWAKLTDAGIVAALANNSATSVTVGSYTSAGVPLLDSTAEAVTVTAQATDSGVDYNVAVGSITDLASVVTGISTVINETAFTGGTDDEDIEAFRDALLQVLRAPESGSPTDLVTWATEIVGVDSATVFPNVDLAGTAAPGTVSVRISGPNGAIPDAPTIAATLALLQSKDMANITILVGTFTANPIAVTVAITEDVGYVLADVQPSVVQAITDYINGIAVGGTLYKAGIIDAIFGLPGIVNVTSTFTDTTQTAAQKATAGTITVT